MARYSGFIVIDPEGEPHLEWVGKNRQQAISTCKGFSNELGYRCLRFTMKIPKLGVN
jgi:hypothetical protein